MKSLLDRRIRTYASPTSGVHAIGRGMLDKRPITLCGRCVPQGERIGVQALRKVSCPTCATLIARPRRRAKR
jgi:hypothetical protein